MIDHPLSPPTPTVFGHFCYKHSCLGKIDPWATQAFPLGHPRFSTAWPNDFHWATQDKVYCFLTSWRHHMISRGSQILPTSANNPKPLPGS
jgi:hypothetical protein